MGIFTFLIKLFLLTIAQSIPERGGRKTNENRRKRLKAPSRMGNIDYNMESSKATTYFNSLSFNDHEVSLYIQVCFSSIGQCKVASSPRSVKCSHLFEHGNNCNNPSTGNRQAG